MLVAALVAVTANYAALRAQDDSVRIVVAATELRAGHLVGASDIAYASVRADDATLAALVHPEDLAGPDGWITTSAIQPGEPLRKTDLRAPSAPAAQRAMSIPVDPEHAVAGDLRVGDRVDVIEVEGRSARYLLTDAEVLAVPDAAGGIAGGLRAFSVTVAVDDGTALQLAVAIRSGQLEIVRSTGSAPSTVQALEDRTAPALDGRTTPLAEEAP
jgi:Flp pilus assembly protein CpaB